MKNRYIKKAHISEVEFEEILKYFYNDFTVSQTSVITGISRPTITVIYDKLRLRIANMDLSLFEIATEEFKNMHREYSERTLEESPTAFGLKRFGDKVYLYFLDNSLLKALDIRKTKIIDNDKLNQFDGVIVHSTKDFVMLLTKAGVEFGKVNVNFIKSFWSYTKRRLMKFNGVSKKKFWMYLKESEFRWNNKNKDLYKSLLNDLENNPL